MSLNQAKQHLTVSLFAWGADCHDFFLQKNQTDENENNKLVVRPEGGMTVKVVVSDALSVYISSLATVPLGRLASGRGGGRG